MLWIYSDIPFLCLPSLTASSVFVPAVCLCLQFVCACSLFVPAVCLYLQFVCACSLFVPAVCLCLQFVCVQHFGDCIYMCFLQSVCLCLTLMHWLTGCKTPIYLLTYCLFLHLEVLLRGSKDASIQFLTTIISRLQGTSRYKA